MHCESLEAACPGDQFIPNFQIKPPYFLLFYLLPCVPNLNSADYPLSFYRLFSLVVLFHVRPIAFHLSQQYNQ
jgi:hypothetical protein